MTTLEELKKLNDEQLEQVAGGNRFETLCDSKFLYDYGLVSDWHGEFHVTFNWISDSAEIDDGWKKAGIISVTSFVNPNKYTNMILFICYFAVSFFIILIHSNISQQNYPLTTLIFPLPYSTVYILPQPVQFNDFAFRLNNTSNRRTYNQYGFCSRW